MTAAMIAPTESSVGQCRTTRTRTELPRPTEDLLDRPFRVFELLHVGQVAAGLHREDKPLRHLFGPGNEDGLRRQAPCCTISRNICSAM